MYNVIDALKLFLLIGLGMMYFLGQGWLVVGPLVQGSLLNKKRDIPFLQEMPLMLLSGLIMNYGIILCFQSLKFSLVAGWFIAIIGLFCFAYSVLRDKPRQELTLPSLNKWIGVSFICLLFLSPILAKPLQDWDARSIWFLHAKMIYVAGSIGQSAGWRHDSLIDFSHTDYPKLVPAVAAQVAYMMDFWNEYIPKAALFFMLVPAVAWLFTFARRSFSFVILLLLVPFSLYNFLWNGYMDGYFALYFSISMLLIGRYINTSQSIDLVSSLCCLIALLYIKNEGALALLAGLFAIISIVLLKKKSYSVKNLVLMNWKYYLAGLIALTPFVLWSFYKRHWNLSNDLEIGTAQSIFRIISRLEDGSYLLIFHGMYSQIEGALLLLGCMYFTSVVWKKSIVKESLPALIAAGIYCLGIAIIYLLTPRDLVWQINESVNRTMLSVSGCIFIGCYFILNEIENNSSARISV